VRVRRKRRTIAAGMALIGFGAVTVAAGAAARAAGDRPGSIGAEPPAALQIFYTAPVLVRAGDDVRIPVDVMCATSRDTACPARVSMSAAAASGPLRQAESDAAPDLGFDVSALASGALASSAPGGRAGPAAPLSGVVRFSIRATSAGAQAQLPSGSVGGLLRFYVVSSLPKVRLPLPRAGAVRHGRVVLSLPWGTGPDHAGVAMGGGAAAVGPSAFDVDRAGRIHLLDTEQSRLTVFAGGRPVRSSRVSAAPSSDLTVARDGTTYILRRGPGDRLSVTPVTADGMPRPPVTVGTGIPGGIESAGNEAYVHVYPLDAWLPVSGAPAPGDAGDPAVGAPVPGGGRLLSVARGRWLRLGMLRGGEVRAPVQVGTAAQLGELMLAEPDGSGGYVAVVHVWRDAPRVLDAYEAVRIDHDRVIASFALPRGTFSSGASPSQFRVGPGGSLYQLRATPSGVQVVRYRMGGRA